MYRLRSVKSTPPTLLRVEFEPLSPRSGWVARGQRTGLVGRGWAPLALRLDEAPKLYIAIAATSYLLSFVAASLLGLIGLGASVRVLLYEALGLASVWAGARLVRPRRVAVRRWAGASRSFRVLGILACCFVAIVYFWRASEGVFYTHGAALTVSPDWKGILRDVYGSSLALPAVIWLGLANAARTIRAFKRLDRLLVVGLVGLLFLSSQARPAALAVVLYALAASWPRPLLVTWRRAILLGVTGGLIFAGVFLVRVGWWMISPGAATPDSVIRYALPATWQQLDQAWSPALSNLLSRAAQLTLFTETISDVIGDGAGHAWGRCLLYSVRMSVPRALWPSKPGPVEPLDVYVERYYGLPVEDTAVTPVSLGYIEAGVFGVIVTHMLLGSIFAWAARQFVSRPSTIWPVFYAFLLANILDVEGELFFQVAAAVKATGVTILVAWLIRVMMSSIRGALMFRAGSAFRAPARAGRV